jgi:hypothetical protein
MVPFTEGTTMTIDTALVFTGETKYINTKCPEWCSFPQLHAVDSTWRDGRESRGHEGPDFGDFLDAGGFEFADAPGVVAEVTIHAEDLELSPEALRQLAVDAVAAAEWLEAQQA